MKLYYAPGTCSLAPLIVAEEAGIALELERVDIRATPHVTARGQNYASVNELDYVPALVLDGGEVLTEGVAIVQCLADLKPEARLAPPAGTLDRARLQSWLNFVATELHKMFSPWLFHPEYGPQAADVARTKIAERLRVVERHLAEGRHFLLGERFGVADAYLFTILGWSAFGGIDLEPLPAVRDYQARIGARPAVRAARKAHAADGAA